MLLSSLSLGVLIRNKDFQTPLAFGDHDAIKVIAVITFLYYETSALKIYGIFIIFDFVNISPIAFITFYCKIRLALTYEIIADLVINKDAI